MQAGKEQLLASCSLLLLLPLLLNILTAASTAKKPDGPDRHVTKCVQKTRRFYHQNQTTFPTALPKEGQPALARATQLSERAAALLASLAVWQCLLF